MNLNAQQVEMAVGAGLELLGEKSEIVIPVKLNDGVFLLKHLLVQIATGGMGLTPTMASGKIPPPKPPAPPRPPRPRPIPKKRSKKKPRKK